MVDASSAAAGAAKWIGSALVEEAKYLYGAEDHVQGLQRDLMYMHQLLQDVDANPHLTRQDGQLRNFVQDIRELAFRAEDAIDSYVVDVATKINRKSFLMKFACVTAHSYPVHKLIKEIETVQQDEVVVGIDADISRLAKHLVDLEENFKVLAIVGTGGAGKTTLAAQLYNHHQVKSRFPHRTFVSISQQWSSVDVLQRIYKEVKGGNVLPSSELELVREIHDFLKDKQCLVVLDDMWKTKAWDDIYPTLPHSNKGCRVIITTRIEEVPMYADSRCIIHEPKLLTEDEKWELFSKVAMEGRVGIEKNAEFEKLGRQMLEKCEGLPLQVVTLAGVLRTKQEWYQWEEISKACTYYILKGKGNPNYGVVEDMLELSYLDLPTYLKPCFLYFALFFEDWIFLYKIILGMWSAEGFITNDLKKGQETLEDIAMRLLEELARRCLVREFCIKKAKDYQFVESVSFKLGSRQPRRTTVMPREIYPQEENHHLRTLFNLGHLGVELPIEGRGNLESIPNNFKLLRVMCIWGLDYVALPDQIGNLIHLRYLCIIHTKISVLPKSIRNLRNLLYLLYKSTSHTEVAELPNGLVGNMENLRELVLPESLKHGSLNRLGLNGQKKLQSLRSGAGMWMTKELPTLSTNVRDLFIYGIRKNEEMEALYQCSCIKENSLLRLELRYNNLSTPSEETPEFDIKKLRDCTTLCDLHLDGPLMSSCVGTTIQFPPNLVSLFLAHSAIKEHDDLMHVLGELPKLKELSLARGSYLGMQLSCTAGGFLQLRILDLSGLVNLVEWKKGQCLVLEICGLAIVRN